MRYDYVAFNSSIILPCLFLCMCRIWSIVGWSCLMALTGSISEMAGPTFSSRMWRWLQEEMVYRVIYSLALSRVKLWEMGKGGRGECSISYKLINFVHLHTHTHAHTHTHHSDSICELSQPCVGVWAVVSHLFPPSLPGPLLQTHPTLLPHGYDGEDWQGGTGEQSFFFKEVAGESLLNFMLIASQAASQLRYS